MVEIHTDSSPSHSHQLPSFLAVYSATFVRLLLNKLAEIKLRKRANECDYRWQIKLNAVGVDESRQGSGLHKERVREGERAEWERESEGES